MVGCDQVEPGAVHQQHAFGPQKVEHELLVGLDAVHRRVDPGEQVQRPLGHRARYAGDRRQQVVGHVALAGEPATRRNERCDALTAAERGLDDVLGGHVGAQSHVGQHVDARQIVRGPLDRPRDRQPPGSVSRHPVRLGQPVERQRQHVGGHRCGQGVLGVVVEHLVVDLIRAQHQPVARRNVGQAPHHLLRIHRTGRVVGVDDHQGNRGRGDLGFDVGQVGCPVGALIAHVVHRATARQRHRSGPQRVVGGGDQHLVAVVQQRRHRHGDQLGYPVAQVHPVDVEAAEAAFLVVLHDRSPGGQDAFGVGVPLCMGQLADVVLLDLVGGVEPERGRVADVELEDVVALILQALGLGEDGPANVVEHVGQLVGLLPAQVGVGHRHHAAGGTVPAATPISASTGDRARSLRWPPR